MKSWLFEKNSNADMNSTKLMSQNKQEKSKINKIRDE